MAVARERELAFPGRPECGAYSVCGQTLFALNFPGTLGHIRQALIHGYVA